MSGHTTYIASLEGGTPKDKVLAKYPGAVARRNGNDPTKPYSYNRWAVYTSAEPGARQMGSTGTTATAWSTAAKEIWRDAKMAEREAREHKLMEATLERYLSAGYSKPTLFAIFSLFEFMNENNSFGEQVTVAEFIQFLDKQEA